MLRVEENNVIRGKMLKDIFRQFNTLTKKKKKSWSTVEQKLKKMCPFTYGAWMI